MTPIRRAVGWVEPKAKPNVFAMDGVLGFAALNPTYEGHHG